MGSVNGNSTRRAQSTWHVSINNPLYTATGPNKGWRFLVLVIEDVIQTRRKVEGW